jgi:hypothetical protein
MAHKGVDIFFHTRKLRGGIVSGKPKTWNVRPGHLHVSRGDKITFSPKTLAVLWFPNRKLFGVSLVTIYGRRKRILTVRTNKRGHYRYRVCCIAEGRFAHGSQPEMIVP